MKLLMNNYDASMHDLDSYREIGDFHFNEAEYLHTLTTKQPLIKESL